MERESRVTKIQQAAFQERFRKINADCDRRTVWECIDRPIRPLVFEIARIGMIPKFSCCGYSYDNEEEPKSHHGSMAYIFFYVPESQAKTFNDFIYVSTKDGWQIRPFVGFVWHLFTRNPVPDNMYEKSDGINEAIHQYEGYGLKIEHLAAVLQGAFSTINDPVTIRDGNAMYEGIQNWIVKPKLSFTIGVEEYYAKYGRIDKESWSKTEEDRIGVPLLNPTKFEKMKTEWLTNIKTDAKGILDLSMNRTT